MPHAPSARCFAAATPSPARHPVAVRFTPRRRAVQHARHRRRRGSRAQRDLAHADLPAAVAVAQLPTVGGLLQLGLSSDLTFGSSMFALVANVTPVSSLLGA